LVPTIGGLVLLGSAQGSQWELFSFLLNPFNQQLKSLRPARAEEASHPSKIVAEFGIPLSGAPTWIMTASQREGEWLYTVLWIAKRAEDLAATIDLLRKFPGSPWDRISAEMDASMALPHGEGVRPHREAKGQDIIDYATTVMDRKHRDVEARAFIAAWEASIDAQEANGSSLSDAAMPIEDLWDVMSILLRPLTA
jgi:hypothetical protein